LLLRVWKLLDINQLGVQAKYSRHRITGALFAVPEAQDEEL
jgi:hypothetical protein